MEASRNQTSRHLSLCGHSLSDYKKMFSLSQKDLEKKILDFDAGPSCFNAQLHQQNAVTSVDQNYSLPVDSYKKTITASAEALTHSIRKAESAFNWNEISSPDQYEQQLQKNIQIFLNDFPEGKTQQRYRSFENHPLAFHDGEFDLALAAYVFFGHRIHASLNMHLAAILDLARVATEIRIFPLLDQFGEISPIVGPLSLALQQRNLGVEIREVSYEFQKHGNAMLRITSLECPL